jgi:hypothetical protein
VLVCKVVVLTRVSSLFSRAAQVSKRRQCGRRSGRGQRGCQRLWRSKRQRRRKGRGVRDWLAGARGRPRLYARARWRQLWPFAAGFWGDAWRRGRHGRKRRGASLTCCQQRRQRRTAERAVEFQNWAAGYTEGAHSFGGSHPPGRPMHAAASPATWHTRSSQLGTACTPSCWALASIRPLADVLTLAPRAHLLLWRPQPPPPVDLQAQFEGIRDALSLIRLDLQQHTVLQVRRTRLTSG